MPTDRLMGERLPNTGFSQWGAQLRTTFAAGQNTRVVTSYKLIARGTVEEKILTLQTRKREVIKATLAGEEQLAESLTWEEIQELLA